MLDGMTDFDTEHGSVDFLDLLSSGSAQDDADSRLESVAFACLVNGLADERAAAILGILDFSDDFLCFAIGGKPLHTMAGTRAAIRRAVRDGDDERSVRGADHAACGGDARCNVYQYAVGVLDEGAGVPGTFAPRCRGCLPHGAGGPFGDCGGSRIAAGSAPDACR